MQYNCPHPSQPYTSILLRFHFEAQIFSADLSIASEVFTLNMAEMRHDCF